MTEIQSPATAREKVARRDSFFGWEHLLLLTTPFPVLLIGQIAYIFGSNSDARDSIIQIYIWPAFILSLGTRFVVPAALVIAVLFFVGRNIFTKRPKRLILYGVVLLAFPIAINRVDASYLRFVLQENEFKSLLAGKSSSMPEHSAYCFLFDQVEDHFYFGGANFAPYDVFVLYVSDDVMSQPSPRIDTLLPSSCPIAPLGNIHRLTGRFYMADTFQN
jgi:hypothetical protein